MYPKSKRAILFFVVELNLVNVAYEWPFSEDRTSLPYTNAVLMESMRMATIVPNALPHTATENISVNGYIIPKVWYSKENFATRILKGSSRILLLSSAFFSYKIPTNECHRKWYLGPLFQFLWVGFCQRSRRQQNSSRIIIGIPKWIQQLKTFKSMICYLKATFAPLNVTIMAILVEEFLREEYKIRNAFG